MKNNEEKTKRTKKVNPFEIYGVVKNESI